MVQKQRKHRFQLKLLGHCTQNHQRPEPFFTGLCWAAVDLATKEDDSDTVVGEGLEASRGGLEALDFGVNSLSNGVVDPVFDVAL
jgi:hypothetical protein